MIQQSHFWIYIPKQLRSQIWTDICTPMFKQHDSQQPKGRGNQLPTGRWRKCGILHNGIIFSLKNEENSAKPQHGGTLKALCWKTGSCTRMRQSDSQRQSRMVAARGCRGENGSSCLIGLEFGFYKTDMDGDDHTAGWMCSILNLHWKIVKVVNFLLQLKKKIPGGLRSSLIWNWR